MVYLASGGLWLTMGQVTATVAGFALTYVFGNFVPKEVFGNYKYVLSLAGLFGTLALTGMGSAVTQAVARGFDGALRHGFRAYLRWSSVSVVATLAGALYYELKGNEVLALSLLVVAFCSPLLSSLNLYTSFLQGKKDFLRNTVYGFVISVSPPLAVGVLIMAGWNDHIPLLVLAYYVAIIIPAAYFHHRTLDIYRPSERKDHESVPYALHLSLINLLGRVASYIDKVLVFHFLGAAALAVYAFAAAPPQYVLKFNGVFRTLALPKLAARDVPTLKRTLPRKIALHFVAAFTVMVLYMLAVPYFFSIFFPLYAESIPYAQALGLTILSAPGVWLGQTLIAHMKKRALYVLNIASPLIKIGLYVTLIPLYGIWGVVAAVILSGFVGFVLASIIFKRL
jgi:O-antigen/teichoic acid export membrane protein